MADLNVPGFYGSPDVVQADVSAGSADGGINHEAAIRVNRVGVYVDRNESVSGVVRVPRSEIATDFASPLRFGPTLRRRIGRAFVRHGRSVSRAPIPN